jgi:hypothetical protein
LPTPQTAVIYPLHFVRFYEGRGPALRDRYLSRVGENSDPSFADWVYIVVEHAPRPTTFKAAVGWDRRRSADRSNLEGGPTLRD